MGSNLCNFNNEPVWLLNSCGDVPVGLAIKWAGKDAGIRQKILHPKRTKVYIFGDVPNDRTSFGYTEQDYRKRGWGEISQASYHKFLIWLEDKMNGDINPANWDDFAISSRDLDPSASATHERILPPNLFMKMRGLPKFAERDISIDPVHSAELLRRAKSSFPVYAFGYNWLDSNGDAAESLGARIEKIIEQNNIGAAKCTQVILVTHSMGGLVARACSQLPGMAQKIVGILHGVMPATGAAVAYRRCKVGMKDEDFKAGLVIGSSGKEVTAVFAQSPGALQLLPSTDYGSNWLQILNPSGRAMLSLPQSDPYEEIYLQKGKWWALIREEWLAPKGGSPISWDKYCNNVRLAKEFHQTISKHYHHNTHVFYGGGVERSSFSKISWTMRRGLQPDDSRPAPTVNEVLSLSERDVRTDGFNNLYVGGKTVIRTSYRGDASVATLKETSFWEIHCGHYDSAGDGTVPASSGRNPRSNGSRSILQQFELEKILHEPAYRDYPLARQIAYYAITKLAVMADLS
jgi:pimeloyl-ACP methyl ester carboxylesterase